MRTTTPMPPLENDLSLLLAEAVATKIKWSLTLHLRNFLYPLFGHKHSYTSSAFVVPEPVDLYLESLPLIVRQLPPQYMVSWIQQISNFLWDSVSNTSQTLPLRAFTFSVPTLNFLRYLLDSPQWPDPASNSWQAKPETLPMELWCLLAPPNSDSIVVITI